MLTVVPNAVFRSAAIVAAEYPEGAAVWVLVTAAYEFVEPALRQNPDP